MAPTNPIATGSPPLHERHPLRDLHWKYATCAAPPLPFVLAQRETRGQGRRFNATLQSHGALLRRLAVDATLESHRGCVNHLRWNEQGTLLASGSDDTRLILWDYATHRVRADIATGHVLNIFAVCFVPGTQDHILATGAMDKDVRIHYAPFRRDSTKRFRFHRGRVKDIASSPGVPRVFWSVGEDGVVFQFDLRSLPATDGSTADGDPSGALIRLGKGRHGRSTLRGMAMAVHPLDPTQVVVACGDFYTRMYDRRMLRVDPYRVGHHAATRAVEIFAPPHLHIDASCDDRTQRRHDDAHGTSVQFSSDGTQVLANYHNDHIYLYNVRYRTPRVAADEDEDLKTPHDSKTVLKLDAARSSPRQVTPTNATSQPPGARMDLSPSSTALRPDDVRTLFSQGVVALLAGRHASALTSFLTAGSASCVASMPASFRKDLLFQTAKAYLGRAWRADAYLAALHAKLALAVDDRPEREIEKLYIEALDASRRYKHVLYRAALYQTRHPQHQEDVEEMIKEAMARQATPRRDRHLRVYRRRRRRRSQRSNSSSSSSSEAEADANQLDQASDDYSDSDESDDDSDSDDEELHIEEEPVPSRAHDEQNGDDEEDDEDSHNEDTHAPLLEDEDARYWRSPRREHCAVNCEPERRFIGYCNLQTDIKEASFFGPNDAYIVAGSDDGRAYIWDKLTGRVVNAIEADADIVNCVQPHPYDVCLATSGIENVVRLWKPTGDSSDELSRDELDEMIAQNQSNMADSASYYLAGANPNIIRLIFQSDQHEGVQECATS
ncbi:hypothetical protein PINS_up009678 [Pythium insidiosum]|nr:hypothetical protein PINS_up009678 [Pythium insidiosum]